MSARWLRRLIWGITGLAWFFWLGIEDRSVVFVMAMAFMAAVSILLALPIQTWFSSVTGAVSVALSFAFGALSGAAVPLLAVLLMFMKVSLHSHATPDFRLQQVVSVLAVVHIWSAAGAILAIGWWLVQFRSE